MQFDINQPESVLEALKESARLNYMALRARDKAQKTNTPQHWQWYREAKDEADQLTGKLYAALLEAGVYN
jgi:hypothetical protein